MFASLSDLVPHRQWKHYGYMSRLAIDALGGEAITLTQMSSPRQLTYIKVFTVNKRGWRVPVSREISWPSFLALFGDVAASMELYGGSLEFEDEDGVVNGERWSNLIEMALTSPVELHMKDVRPLKDDPALRIVSEPAELISSEGLSPGAHTPIRAAEEVDASTAEREESKHFAPPKPAVTLHLERTRTLQLFKHTGSSSNMRNLANSFQTILRNCKRSMDRMAYRKCPAAK